MSVVVDLNRWDDQDNDEEYDRDKNGGEDAKSTNRSNVAKGVSSKSHGGGHGSHQNSSECALECISDSTMFIVCCKDHGGLAVSVAVNEDVVGCDSKDNENSQLIERCVHRDLKNARVDEVSHWERHEDHQHREGSNKKTAKVEPDVAEDEEETEGCVSYVTLNCFLKDDIVDETAPDLSLHILILRIP